MIFQKSLERPITEARIVESATQLFARQGFKATTTREIAELASVNEATLFRYFARKPDIFWAAIKSRLTKIRMSCDLETALLETNSPDVAIQKMVRFLINSFTQQPELVGLLQVATFEMPDAHAIIGEHLGPIFDTITEYYRRCSARGDIGPIEPPLATIGLVALVVANRYVLELSTENPVAVFETEANISNLAQLWLRALTPPANPVPNCAFTA